MTQTTLFDNAKKLKGYKCGCCDQYVKMYRRNLNSSMAIVLILMHKHLRHEKDYTHIENWLKQIGRTELRADYHKLRLWGLIDKKAGNRDDGSKRNGFYKISGRGILFVEEKLKVHEKVLIFNDKFEGYDGEMIDIRKALGNKFSYKELMNNQE